MASVFVLGISVLDFTFEVEDFPTGDAKYRATDARMQGGGMAANAASAIARLGGDAMLCSRLGDDLVGDMIVDELQAIGVNTEQVNRASGGVSSYSSVMLNARGERQLVNFRGRGLVEDAGVIRLPDDAGAVLVDTRWEEGAFAAIQLGNAAGIPTILDGEEPVPTRAMELASHLAFSAQGLRSVLPGESLEHAVNTLAAQLGKWVCVTDGANGVYYCGAAGAAHEPAPSIEVADSLGAGDVWHGAFALMLAEGRSEADAVRFASVAATIKCTRHGAREAMPTRDETIKFMKEAGYGTLRG